MAPGRTVRGVCWVNHLKVRSAEITSAFGSFRLRRDTGLYLAFLTYRRRLCEFRLAKSLVVCNTDCFLAMMIPATQCWECAGKQKGYTLRRRIWQTSGWKHSSSAYLYAERVAYRNFSPTSNSGFRCCSQPLPRMDRRTNPGRFLWLRALGNLNWLQNWPGETPVFPT